MRARIDSSKEQICEHPTPHSFSGMGSPEISHGKSRHDEAEGVLKDRNHFLTEKFKSNNPPSMTSHNVTSMIN